eukprot:4201920-Pleurochrysis_carterae.AAC.3
MASVRICKLRRQNTWAAKTQMQTDGNDQGLCKAKGCCAETADGCKIEFDIYIARACHFAWSKIKPLVVAVIEGLPYECKCWDTNEGRCRLILMA